MFCLKISKHLRDENKFNDSTIFLLIKSLEMLILYIEINYFEIMKG